MPGQAENPADETPADQDVADETVAETVTAPDYSSMGADKLTAAHEAASAEYAELDAKRDKLPADVVRLNVLAAETKAISEAWATLHEPVSAPSELLTPEAIGNRKRQAAEEAEKAAKEAAKEAEEVVVPAEEAAPAEEPAPKKKAKKKDAAADDSEPVVEPVAEPVVEEVVVPDTPAELVDTRETVAAAHTPRLPDTPGLAPFQGVNPSGKVLKTADDLRDEFAQRTASKSRTPVTVATFSPFEGNGYPTLTSNPSDNHQTLYGGKPDLVRTAAFGSGKAGTPLPERTSYTAALNCAGPPEPVMDIPICYTSGRPLMDSGLVSLFNAEVRNGQIQLYDCHQLPAIPDLTEAGDCGDEGHGCSDCGADVECFAGECIVPGTPLEPARYVSCMCIPESMTFSNRISFDQAMIDFAVATDQQWETRWLAAIRANSLVRTVSGLDHPEHGANNTLIGGILQVGSRLASDCRCSNSLQDYTAFIPCGEAMFYTAMADRMRRVLGSSLPGEDIVEWLDNHNIPVEFGLDADPDGAAVAAGFTAAWSDTTLGVPIPLEEFVTAGTIHLIPRDTLAAASPLQTELGFEFKDHCQVHNGCLKLTRSEWWFDPFKIGCKDIVTLDFTDLCPSGSGPDLVVGTC